MEVVLSESSSPVPSADHPQPSDSVADQLTALSLAADNNGDGDDGGAELVRSEDGVVDNEFPVRVEADNCSFYLRTGMCKFGMHCKFNHPPDRKYQGSKVKRKEDYGDGAEVVNGKDDFSGKEGQIDCKYFDRPGGCRFGKACKFNHSRKAALQLNYMGLPVRPGENVCPYYMRNGSCKYGANCRFNHPDPSSRGPDLVSGYSNGGSILSSNASKPAPASWPSSAVLNGSPPYVPLIFPPSQVVTSQTELNAYQAPMYPPPARNINLPVPPAYAMMNSQSLGRTYYTHQQTQIFVDEFPERPGQPECSYFVKTGNCKYRSACKFHHPKSAIANSRPCTLSDLGLPLRPGISICSYYNRYGICKYGPSCKYDHPVNYGHPLPLGVSPMNLNPFLGNSIIREQAMVVGN